jgi:hypothetical protein
MKPRYLIIIFGIIAITVGIIKIESLCNGRQFKKSSFSFDKLTAIKEGFYIDAYLPFQQSLAIPNTKDTITFDSAWSEHSWTTERRLGLCLLEHKVKGDSYNYCIPFSTTSSDVNTYPFELKQLRQVSDPYYDPGEYFQGRFNFGSKILTDTIEIAIFTKESEGIKANHLIDTLIFIIAKKGR